MNLSPTVDGSNVTDDWIRQLQQENKRLRCNLSLAEEELANYQQEVEALGDALSAANADAVRLHQENERLRELLSSLIKVCDGTYFGEGWDGDRYEPDRVLEAARSALPQPGNQT